MARYKHYTVVKVVSDDLIFMRLDAPYLYPDVNRQLWARCRVRKDHICAGCGKAIGTGSLGYRPLTNQLNRYHRLCLKCIGGENEA